MIIDTIRHRQDHQFQYGEAVCRALEYVINMNTADMRSTVEFEGKNMYVMKQKPMTKLFEEQLAEAHACYADIHFVLEGEEWQGFASTSDLNQTVEDKLEQSDYILFEHVENEGRIRLLPGDFTVYWPGEIHRPNCHPTGSVHLVKLVVKIHRDLL
ncbi:YhcH/YjgK/YiaL family protein [Paenibacillus sp. 2RAB27]|uniref:YhcH/YjgK/YiaL family protein n=1 Tax=Paenibacillus sp. 2RAB27 TaxID=3232991 RepID=UPI003F9C5538